MVRYCFFSKNVRAEFVHEGHSWGEYHWVFEIAGERYENPEWVSQYGDEIDQGSYYDTVTCFRCGNWACDLPKSLEPYRRRIEKILNKVLVWEEWGEAVDTEDAAANLQRLRERQRYWE